MYARELKFHHAVLKQGLVFSETAVANYGEQGVMMWLRSIPKVPAKRSAVPEEVMYFRMLLIRLLLCLYFEATLLYGEQKRFNFAL